jgi:hypothetical protein
MTNAIQVWFWELLMPLFLKRSANPTSLDWLYSYKVDWDAPLEGTASRSSLPALNETGRTLL